MRMPTCGAWPVSGPFSTRATLSFSNHTVTRRVSGEAAKAPAPDAGVKKSLNAAVEKLAVSVASGSINPLKSFTEHATPTWRRRRVSMDDVTDLYEGLRIAVATVLAGEAAAFADRALLEGIAVLKWHRRLGGDTRKRNRILKAIYKGA